MFDVIFNIQYALLFRLKEFLPKEYVKNKGIEKKIFHVSKIWVINSSFDLTGPGSINYKVVNYCQRFMIVCRFFP